MRDELAFSRGWTRQHSHDAFRAEVSREFLSHAGHRINPILDPVMMRAEDHATLTRAGRTLLETQRTLLENYFRPRMSVEDLVTSFHIPGALASILTWDDLTRAVPPIARHDVLLSSAGRFQICELNVDSSVGGGETHELAKLYLRHFGKHLTASTRTRLLEGPYAALAKFLRAECQAHLRTRVVLLDWSSWASRGFFTTHLLKSALEAALPGIVVAARDELEYARELESPEVVRHDLVYRLFLAEDALGDLGFLRKVLASGVRMISGFESEVYSSKLWLAHFHDPVLRALLTAGQRACIDRYVPFTEIARAGNLERLLARKDSLVWKVAGSFGGKGILIGNQVAASEIRAAVDTAPPGTWIAQQYISPKRLAWHDDETGAVRALNVVLGLYEMGHTCAGALVRADDACDVVNVSNGARMAWALPLPPEEIRSFI